MDNIVETLISLTKRGKLEWDYLESDSSIYEKLNYCPKYNTLSSRKKSDRNKQNRSKYEMDISTGQKLFDISNSFYTKVNDNYIVLIVDSSDNSSLIIDKLSLLLLPRTFREPEVINSNENLLYLQSIIKSQFPSVDDIKKDLFDLDDE